MRLEAIQEALRNQQLKGWLFFDHHHRDPLAYRVLGLPLAGVPTRRWYYWVPSEGDPIGLVHRIEPHSLGDLPGERLVYSRWSEQTGQLKKMIGGNSPVAMQYSPECAIPYVSNVDGGTLELIRNLGAEVVSSADLIQQFEAVWTQEQFAMHQAAGRKVDAVRAAAFAEIGRRLRAGERCDEWGIAEFIRNGFEREQMETDHGPIVGVNAHAGDPHYEPSASGSAEIKQGDFVLIDLWAKLRVPDAVYYDITWVGNCGPVVNDQITNVFGIVRDARDAAVARVQSGLRSGEDLRGFQVDDAARSVIADAGYSEKFIHRTGHSIGTEVHGVGANMDNLESHDERRLIPHTCFSVEPGIYLPAFGVRLEVNVFTSERDAMVTGEVQREVVAIL